MGDVTPQKVLKIIIMYIKTKKSMRVAIAIACTAAVISAAMGILSLMWGCFLSGVIAIAFIARYVYLKIRAKSEPYYTEMGGVIMLVDPKESHYNDPFSYLE